MDLENSLPVVRQPVAAAPEYTLGSDPVATSVDPEGLQTLAGVDELIILQVVDLLEVVSFWEFKNKYRIFNSDQKQVYLALEESDTCNRLFCGSKRGLVLHIEDNQKREVLTIVREFRCFTECCWCADGCCKYPAIVNDKAGCKLGMVRPMNSWYRVRFGIFDEHDKPLYEMWAPWCPWQCVCCRGDINVPICNINDKSQVGNIRKIWSGVVQEGFTKADAFRVSFPMNLLVTHKALMLASVFLVDFAIFENRKKKTKHTKPGCQCS